MFLEFSFGYNGDFTQQEYESILTLGLEGVPDTLEKMNKVGSWTTFRGDIKKVMRAVPGRKIEIKCKATPSLVEYIAQQLEEMGDRLKRVETVLEGDAIKSQQFNAKCVVHVPGNELMSINEIFVQNDACTEEIGRYLCEGWRIVSVCPQPNQRRPDYVLGRVKK